MTFADRHYIPTDVATTNPVLVTLADHGLLEGQRLIATKFLSDAPSENTGMEQLNNREFVVHVVDSNSFSLYDVFGNQIDGTNYSPFTYTGTAQFTLTGPDLNYENTA